MSVLSFTINCLGIGNKKRTRALWRIPSGVCFLLQKKKSLFGQMIEAVVLHLCCHEQGCFRMILLIFCNQKIALVRKLYEPRSKPSHSELISSGSVTPVLCLSIRKDLQTGDMTRISDNVYFQRNLQYQRKFLTLLSIYFLLFVIL